MTRKNPAPGDTALNGMQGRKTGRPIHEMIPYLLLCCLSVGIAYGQATPGTNLDQRLTRLAKEAGLQNNLQDDTEITSINAPLAQLGKKLFFSKSLSGDFEVACASCHHPFLAGGDSLSLPVGTGAKDSDLVGPGRVHAVSQMIDPRADGAPNVARHSPSTFNSVFYKKALFHDGRVFLQGGEDYGQGTRTPDSVFNSADPDAGEDLLGAQSRFPITAGEEMRGLSFEKNSPSERVRSHIAGRLGNYGAGLGELIGLSWLRQFRQAFNAPDASAEELVTFANIMKALSAYQASQVFVATPWTEYLAGDNDAISLAAKEGALLFFLPEDKGGAACSACHSGDFFSDEKFYNLAVPQIGRGLRSDGSDRGRYEISKNEADKFAFRTPSLLNVGASGPYTHAGAFDTLEDVIRHHWDPAASVADYDFTLDSLAQFAGSQFSYPNAEENTRLALAAYEATNPQDNKQALSQAQVTRIVAFLHTLTDPCIRDAQCLTPWAQPGESPDGKTLQARFATFNNDPKTWGRENNDMTARAKSARPSDELPASDYITRISITAPNAPDNDGENGQQFTNIAQDMVFDRHLKWDMNALLMGSEGTLDKLSYFNPAQHFGGVAAGDYDRDGLIDFYVTGSNSAGGTLLRNIGNGRFEDRTRETRTTAAGRMTAGAKFVDVDGDNWLDLLLSGHRKSGMRLLANNGKGAFEDATPSSGLASTRNSYSTAFSDFDRDGDLDLAVGRWSITPGEDNHLYTNDGSGRFVSADRSQGFLVARFSNLDMSFTPNFVDLDADNWSDLLFANDFKTTQVLRNIGGGIFSDVTDRRVVTDENAMGASLGDYDNDGDEDWFVTSIFDSRGNDGRGRWFASGNKLYRNDGGTLTDVSAQAGIKDGSWGWGSCFFDVQNNGDLDIFHVNGFGNLSQDIISSFGIPGLEKSYPGYQYFADKAARLFVSNGNGTFKEAAGEYALNIASEGRGVSCVDFDRDGDMDIVIANNQQAPAILRNNHNLDNGNRFISLRLQQPGGNTQAIGAKVSVTAGGRTYYKQLALGSNYLSHNPAELHFGLGKAASVEKLEITWPGGSPVTRYSNLPINAHFNVQRHHRDDRECCSASAALKRAINHFEAAYPDPGPESHWLLESLAALRSSSDNNSLATLPRPTAALLQRYLAALEGTHGKLANDLRAPFTSDQDMARELLREFTESPGSDYALIQQFLALEWSRQLARFPGSELYQRIPVLLDKINREQKTDLRFSNLYLERAIVLALYGKVGKAQLGQWVETTVNAQLPGGGWPNFTWAAQFNQARLVMNSTERTDALGLTLLGLYDARPEGNEN